MERVTQASGGWRALCKPQSLVICRLVWSLVLSLEEARQAGCYRGRRWMVARWETMFVNT